MENRLILCVKNYKERVFFNFNKYLYDDCPHNIKYNLV